MGRTVTDDGDDRNLEEDRGTEEEDRGTEEEDRGTEEDPGDSAEDGYECPFCGSTDTERESAFGSEVSAEQHYCNDCNTVFERIKFDGASADTGRSPDAGRSSDTDRRPD